MFALACLLSKQKVFPQSAEIDWSEHARPAQSFPPAVLAAKQILAQIQLFLQLSQLQPRARLRWGSLRCRARMCSPAVSPLKLESFSPNSRGQREGETQPTFFPHQHPIRTKPTLINSVFFPERAFTLLPSDLGKLIFAPLHHHHCQLPRNSQGTALQHVAQEGLDIVSYLPVEISVAILLYLTPQDLCR